MRKTNDGKHKVQSVVGTTDDEMDALDKLGPLMRRAIYESPIRWSALAVIRQVEDAQERERLRYPAHVRDKIILDPKDPRIDAGMARGLLIESGKIIRMDRDEADALLGVKPIIPRHGTTRDLKVLRSERIAERRARRFYQ